LPIKLIYFRGVHTGSSVKLNWATATETNNDYFTIERSVNGVDFSFVQKIKGAGNSTALLYYNTQDNNPVNGIGYYRLKQTDYDGKYSYSNLVAVNSFAEGNLSFSVFPNPAQDGETSVIQITDKANGEFVISIHDAIGKERYSKAVMTSNENSSYSLNVPKGLAPGLYFVTATSGNDVYSRKLIVK
jgi:hypothetical protein